MGMMINRRRVMGKKLPYDAEIEYLESDGNAYIDTSIIPSSDIRLNVDGSFLSNSPAQFGVIDMNNGVYRRFHLGIDSGHSWQAGIGTSYNSNSSANTNRHLFRISGLSGNAFIDSIKIECNNSAFPTIPIYLFARNFNGTPHLSINRIISAHIYKYSQDKYLIDLIPVRVGQVGYMYDKVSGQLFGNSGTGVFILGSDKN